MKKDEKITAEFESVLMKIFINKGHPDERVFKTRWRPNIVRKRLQ